MNVLQGKDQSVSKIFLGILHMYCMYLRNHSEHVTSQPVDMSNFRSALRDDEDKLEHLTREYDKQSKELENVKEQLCVTQLIVEDK